jgi:glycosidase
MNKMVSNIYEVNIRQYTNEGTFSAFQKHLPRLKDMGVEMIWLMPITPISQKDKKGSLGSYYACSSYTKINPEFGTEKDFETLVNAIHDLGMKVIIDWVANHTGREHEWMEKNPHWFSQNEQGAFTERNGWDDVVDLNFQQSEMRAALIGAMQYWVRTFSIDGFRCDMAHLVPLDFWKEAKKACETIAPLFWLAECEQREYHEVFEATYAWHWMHVSEKMANSKASIHDIYNVLHEYQQYPLGARKLFFTSNHDENSWNGTEYEKYGAAAKPWAVFVTTWKGITLLYSGQELPNHKRLAFFDKDPIQWKGEPALHNFYKTLFDFRKNTTTILSGETINLPTQTDSLMAYLRYDQNATVLVIINLGAMHQKITLTHEKLAGKFTQLFSGLSYQFSGTENFELLAGDYFVYVQYH